ncbi:dihydroneopterin aldolase [candidate division WOR-3 bacterium]|nr:dihydroneopterin aldolase [candidate division WOR-3 bacterium]
MLDRISLKNMKFYAYHGHEEEERNNGINLEIDIDLYADLSKAMFSDNLKETADYRKIYAAVKEEVMNNKFMLLEKIMDRIIISLFDKFREIEAIRTSVRKPTPSLGGVVESVEVTVYRNRNMYIERQK